MRTRICRIVLTLGLLLAPSVAYAQVEVPPVLFTGPLSHPRYADGGFYVGFTCLYMKTNRPLKDQQIAVRGILDLDGTASGTNIPNTFIGSGQPALNMNDVRGPGVWQPGWDIFFGWRFEGGVTVEFQWRHLVQASYNSQPGLIPFDFSQGNQFQNTFFFSPVTNFSNDWAGNAQNIPNGSSAAIFGIWNAASAMQLEYIQRYDIYGINARMPIWEGSEFRSYGLFGPRIVWIYDRTTWRTVDQDLDGFADSSTVGVYSNTISNRMYGVHGGFGNDWFLGSTPVGGFACTLDVEGGLYLDLVKTRVAWDRGDAAIGNHRARRFNNLVPSAEAKVGLWWYPWEGISVQLGYDVQTYFNTITSYRPVDFNMQTIDPQFDSHFFRWFHGLRIGINFVF